MSDQRNAELVARTGHSRRQAPCSRCSARCAVGLVAKAVRTILADEVQHRRLGWRFLASHPIDDHKRAWIARYLPDMLRGTVRTDLFDPAAQIIGDELTMQKYGTLPIAGRRQAFLDAMREVLLPGLEGAGIDTSLGAAFLDELERQV